MTNGEIPEGLIICHRCNNPRCVNPSHLYAGTHGDNLRDAHRAGTAHVNRRGRPKLTPQQVEDIRGMNDRAAVIAVMYGVSERTIRRIKKGQSWR